MSKAFDELWSRLPASAKAIGSLFLAFTAGGGTVTLAERQLAAPEVLDRLVAEAEQSKLQITVDSAAILALETKVENLERATSETLEIVKSLDRQMCVFLSQNDREKAECAGKVQARSR